MKVKILKKFLISLYIVLIFFILLSFFDNNYYKVIVIESNKSYSLGSKGEYVFILKNEYYEIGNKIAYYSNKTNKEEIILNKVKKIGGNVYVTYKINNSESRYLVRERLIIGKVFFQIKYLGYLILFFQTFIGYLILLIIPGIIIIFIELKKILKKRKNL